MSSNYANDNLVITNKIYEIDNISIPFRLNIEKEVLEYINKNIKWLTANEKILNPKIQVRIEKVKILKREVEIKGKKISRSISLHKETVIWHSNWFKISYEFKDTSLCVFIEYLSLNQNLIRNAYKYLFKHKTTSEINNERLLYVIRMALHFPLFYLLRKDFNIIPLHASAICKKNRAIIFLGFDGVGKSTFAIAMNKFFKYNIISDNFCLIDINGFVYPLIESARVSNEINLLFGNLKTEKISGRYQYPIDYTSYKSSIKADKLFVNYFGVKDCVCDYNKELTCKLIKSMNGILPEFKDYNMFKSLILLIDPDDNFEEFKCDQFINNIEVFGLEKMNIKDIFNLIDKVDKLCN